MAPSTPGDAAVRFILQANSSGGELQLDFKKVAQASGMTLAGNARKFQDQLNKYGYKYEKADSGIIKLEGIAQDVATLATKGTTKAVKQTAASSGTKKRKLHATVEDADEEDEKEAAVKSEA